jgi:hypothetical protein
MKNLAALAMKTKNLTLQLPRKHTDKVRHYGLRPPQLSASGSDLDTKFRFQRRERGAYSCMASDDTST